MSICVIRITGASSLAPLAFLLYPLWFTGCAEPPSPAQTRDEADPSVEAVESVVVADSPPMQPEIATGSSVAPLSRNNEPSDAQEATTETDDDADPFATVATVDPEPTVEIAETAETVGEIEPAEVPAVQESVIAEPGPANGETMVDNEAVEEFREELEPYGEWLVTDAYGTVWQPANAANTGWRPYTDGTWALADEGWTWVSNEPFGATCYHYGRWALLDNCGWVWVPGLEWAPAWVAWRADDEFAGWAPLPPEYTTEYVGAETTYWEATSYSPGPLCYNFVPINAICSTNCATHLVNFSVGLDLFRRTHSYTRFHRDDRKRVCNPGPHDRHFRSKEKLKKLTARQRLLCDRDSRRKGSVRQARSGKTKSSKSSHRLVSARINRGWPEKESKLAARRGSRMASRTSSISSGDKRVVQKVTDDRQARAKEHSEVDARKRRAGETERSRKKSADARRKSEEEQQHERRRQLTAARKKERSEADARKRRAEETERSRKKSADARRKSEEEQQHERRRQLTAAREKERSEADARKRRAEETERSRKKSAEARRKSEREKSRRQRMEEAKRNADRERERAAQAREKRARDEREARNRESARRKQEDDNRRRDAEKRDRERQAQERRDRESQAEAKRRDDDRQRSGKRSRSKSK